MANTTNYNWETPDDTDLVKDGAAAIRTLGSSIDTTTKNLNPETTTGDIAYRSATANTNTRLAIGSAGQVLTVAAGVPSWATPSDQTPLTTKGDVFTFSTVDARLGVGANGTVLTADSAETTGLKWATPAGGGKVLQVIQAVKTDTFSSNSATMVDITGVTATITPSLTSSKVLVMVNFGVLSGDETQGMQLKLLRGATVPISNASGGGADTNDAFWSGLAPSVTNTRIQGTANLVYLDSPSSTSALTYKVQMRQTGSAQIGYVNQWALNADVGGVATITLMEIGA